MAPLRSENKQVQKIFLYPKIVKTPTQPQLNLTQPKFGFYMKMTLHTTTTTTMYLEFQGFKDLKTHLEFPGPHQISSRHGILSGYQKSDGVWDF